jgi:hypothetical protein
VPVVAVTIGSVVPTPWHATVVVVTGPVVDVVEAGTLVAVVGGVVAGVVDSGGAAGLSELLHAAASGRSAMETIRKRRT